MPREFEDQGYSAADDADRRSPPADEDHPADGRDRGGSLTSPDQEEKQMATFAHIGGIIGGFVVPLIIWLMKKDTSRYVDDQGKEALNFQLTLLIGHLVAGVITVATCGIAIPLNLALIVVAVVYSCIAATAVGRGERYRYPSWSIRLIK